VPAYVLHVDLDQFVAAVEILRRPQLRGRPVVVGGSGDPTQRGVVSTASYEARAFGIRSGMPLRLAVRRCPEAVFLPVDAPAYRAASERVMMVLGRFPAIVETAGWDEAFLAVESDDPEHMAAEIRRAVREETSLECSVGIGDNKLRAKIASALAKPAGTFRLTADDWDEVMGTRPPDALWGIGPKRARTLAGLGIRTVGALAAADARRLASSFGPTTGPQLQALARGEDHSPVVSTREPARSMGRETTFQEDLREADRIRLEVERLAAEVARDVARQGRTAARVVVKIRFAPFDTRTHAVSREADAPIEDAAQAALARFDLDRPVRLVGVRADLEPPTGAPPDDGGPTSMRWARDEADLEGVQATLRDAAARVSPMPHTDPRGLAVGGVFAVTGTHHPTHVGPGDAAWAAAVTVLDGETVDAVVVRGRTGAGYRPGYLALVWGPLLEASVAALRHRPAVVLVDATGCDHPRRAGLALHLGAVLNLPTIGVTDRTLVASRGDPGPDRGDDRPLLIDGRVVGYVLRTRPRTRSVCVHAGWATGPDGARDLVLAVTGPGSRTPEPLRRARRLARLRRALDEGRLDTPDVRLGGSLDPVLTRSIDLSGGDV
jgi:DNA polymerase-4